MKFLFYFVFFILLCPPCCLSATPQKSRGRSPPSQRRSPPPPQWTSLPLPYVTPAFFREELGVWIDYDFTSCGFDKLYALSTARLHEQLCAGEADQLTSVGWAAVCSATAGEDRAEVAAAWLVLGDGNHTCDAPNQMKLGATMGAVFNPVPASREAACPAGRRRPHRRPLQAAYGGSSVSDTFFVLGDFFLDQHMVGPMPCKVGSIADVCRACKAPGFLPPSDENACPPSSPKYRSLPLRLPLLHLLFSSFFSFLFFYASSPQQFMVLVLSTAVWWPFSWCSFDSAASPWDPGPSHIFNRRRQLQPYQLVIGVHFLSWLDQPIFNRCFARSFRPGACVLDAPPLVVSSS